MIVDTSAWIRYFEKGQGWEEVYRYLDSGDCHTCVVSIAEIAVWAKRSGNSFDFAYFLIEQLSGILPLDPAVSKLAGEISYERKRTRRKWGVMDSFVAAEAEARETKVLTCDRDFEGLPNAIVI